MYCVLVIKPLTELLNVRIPLGSSMKQLKRTSLLARRSSCFQKTSVSMMSYFEREVNTEKRTERVVKLTLVYSDSDTPLRSSGLSQ